VFFCAILWLPFFTLQNQKQLKIKNVKLKITENWFINHFSFLIDNF